MDTKTHMNSFDPDLWPIYIYSIDFQRLSRNFREAECSGSRVIVLTEIKKRSENTETNTADVSTVDSKYSTKHDLMKCNHVIW